MKRLTTLLMTLMLMSTALWADETITVTANSSDISEGLDLKVVAKLFAEAKDLEQFETMLNNPDSAFCNLDLNGDGQVDYLRVVETGEGNKRLIVLQAILAKDIYQDVASIYVEKDEKTNEVSIQIVGDEYVYGTNYIIEPVYVYRPVIYDWFWSPYWYAWRSPWYWGYYPNWWYYHSCWAHDWYWRHCYAWHRYHHWCSFRPGRSIRHGYHDLHHGVTRRDYAVAHPDRSFSHRNSGMTNAREIRHSSNMAAHAVNQRQSQNGAVTRSSGAVRQDYNRASIENRTYGSRTTAATRSSNTATAQRSSSTATAQRSTTATTTRSSGTAQRSTTATTTRSSGTAQRSSSTATAQRSTSTATTRSSSYSGSTRSSGSSSYSGSSRSSSSSSGVSRSSGSSSYSGSSRSSGSYSGGSRSSGSYSGGSRSSGGGGSVSRSSGGGSRSSGSVRR